MPTKTKPTTPAALQIRALAPGDWAALEELFGKNGACGGCWCMYWRLPTQRDFREAVGEPAKAAFKALVTSGKARGVLAFEGDKAVGWCAFGPRGEFPRTETKRSYVVADAGEVWSINCFYIRRDKRSQGIAGKLLRAAVAEGKKAGAKTFEGYPSVVAPGKKQAAAFIYKGTLTMFEGAGFRIVQRTYPGSPLVRLVKGVGKATS